MPKFRVQEVGPDKAVVREVTQVAGTPEEAALLALGLELFRGTGRNAPATIELRAKVYRNEPNGNPPTMVRLFQATTVNGAKAAGLWGAAQAQASAQRICKLNGS